MKDAASAKPMHDVLDRDAVEVLHRAFVARLREKPAFREAVDKINRFADRPPVLRDTRPMGAPPIDVPQALLSPEIPIDALGRALTAASDEARRGALVWAYTLDPKIQGSQRTQQLVDDAFRMKHETLADVRALEPDEIRHALRDIADRAPELVAALGTHAAYVKDPQNILTLSLESPISRATSLEKQFGLALHDPLIDHAPFLALADAAEIVWVRSGGSAGASMSPSHLMSIMDDVQEAFPEVVARAVLEVDRVARVRKIGELKQAAEERAAQGIAPQPSNAVILAPDVAGAPAAKEEEDELPPEAFVALPEAARGRRTTIRRDRGQIDALLGAAARADEQKKAAPAKEPAPAEVGAATVVSRRQTGKRSAPVVWLAVPVLLIAGGVAIWWSSQTPAAAARAGATAAPPGAGSAMATAATAVSPSVVATATATALATEPAQQPVMTASASVSDAMSAEPERTASAPPRATSSAALPPPQPPPSATHTPVVIPPGQSHPPTPPAVPPTPTVNPGGIWKGGE